MCLEVYTRHNSGKESGAWAGPPGLSSCYVKGDIYFWLIFPWPSVRTQSSHHFFGGRISGGAPHSILDLSFQQGIEPMPPAVEMWSLNL